MRITPDLNENSFQILDNYEGFINSTYCSMNIPTFDCKYLITRLNILRDQFMSQQEQFHQRLESFDQLLSLLLFEPYLPCDVIKSDYLTMILYLRNKVDDEPSGSWMHPLNEKETKIIDSLNEWRNQTETLTNWFNHEETSTLTYREFKYVSP